MCGIAGIAHFDPARPIDEPQISRMADELIHRGPDGAGTAVFGNIGLGHRRLSIIDLETGDQPMLSADRQLALIYNGELYNYIEVRRELQALGRHFVTESDTEVVLQAYDEWGTDCLSRFNGMWAFALWDARKHQLFCARDRLGEKPFYYSIWDESLYFGSEIKALAAGGVPRVFNEEMLDALLSMTYLPAPYTAYVGIKKLPAGCFLVLQGSKVRVQRYWQYPCRPRQELRTDSKAIHMEFEQLFDESVRLRMRSDVPVGAFLSGGLDSGAVVSAMCKATPERVRTCTIGFHADPGDERSHARLVAGAFNTDHVERVMSPEDAGRLFEKLAWHFDEPFGDTSIFPTYIVSGLARERTTVALTGDGGDEVLGGYPIHQTEKLADMWQRLPATIARPALGFAQFTAKSFGRQRIVRGLATISDDFASRLLTKQVGFHSSVRRSLLGDNPRVRPAQEFIDEALMASEATDNLGLLNFWLHTVALPERYLCKVDRCSMAQSLETRVPFLDVRLVELLADVSPAIKMPWLVRKAVLRRTVGKRLPAPLLWSGKRGFDPPLQSWFGPEGPLSSAAMRGLETTGLFVKDAMRQFHESGSDSRVMGIWALAALGIQANSM